MTGIRHFNRSVQEEKAISTTNGVDLRVRADLTAGADEKGDPTFDKERIICVSGTVQDKATAYQVAWRFGAPKRDLRDSLERALQNISAYVRRTQPPIIEAEVFSDLPEGIRVGWIENATKNTGYIRFTKGEVSITAEMDYASIKEFFWALV